MLAPYDISLRVEPENYAAAHFLSNLDVKGVGKKLGFVLGWNSVRRS